MKKTLTTIILTVAFSSAAICQANHIYVEAKEGFVQGNEIYFELTNFNLSICEKPPYVLPVCDTIVWDFGDGNTSENRARIAASTHTYQSYGMFKVYVYLNNQKVDSVQVNIDKKDLPLLPYTVHSPILYYPFDENLNDASGNNRHAEWGNEAGSFAEGISGQSLDLTNDKYARLNSFTELDSLSEFTVSFFAKKRVSNSDGCFIQKTNPEYALKIRYRGTTPTSFNHGAYLLTDKKTLWARGMIDNIGLFNTAWHHLVLTFNGERLTFYVDGFEVGSDTLDKSGVIKPNASDLIIGGLVSVEQASFDGYIDELKFYDKALTANEIGTEFKLIHPGFHCRTRQYIKAQIPQYICDNPANRLRVYVTGGALGVEKMHVIDKSSLQEEEVFLFENYKLPESPTDYSFVAQILPPEGDNTPIFELKERLPKNYDGIPEVGIDENNSIRIKTGSDPLGQLFFPVTPFGLNDNLVDKWVSNQYVNSLYGKGFYPADFSNQGWQGYMDVSEAAEVAVIGPVSWHMYGEHQDVGLSDIDVLREYVTAGKNHPGLLMWIWADEPRLQGINPDNVRAWTYKTQEIDQQHPVVTNHEGSYYIDNLDGLVHKDYTFGHMNTVRDKKRPPTDIFGIDYYPIDRSGNEENTVAQYTKALRNAIEGNMNMLPVFTFIETSNVDEQDTTWGNSPWDISPPQIKMLSWLSVVNGAKGINWFHYFSHTPDPNLKEMSKFVQQVGELTPAILGTEVDMNLSVEIDTTAEIHTMVREYNDTLYIFASRLNEIHSSPNLDNADADFPSGYPDPIQNYTCTATFTLDKSFGNSAEVYNEQRVIDISNKGFSDTFEPYDVHIYKIAMGTSGIANKAKDSSILKVFPNPMREQLNVSFEAQNTGMVNIELYNLQGRKMLELLQKELQAGAHELIFDIDNAIINQGTYILHVLTNSKNEAVLINVQ